MGKLVVLKLGEGNFESGFSVTLQIGEDGERSKLETMGRLPPAPELPTHYRHWQASYCRLGLRSRLEAKTGFISNVSKIEDCDRAATVLRDRFNEWLHDQNFRTIRETLLEQLIPSEEVRVILQADDPKIQRLPWHLWDWFERYPHAEIALSTPAYNRIEPPSKSKSQVRILAILGHSEGIDIAADRALLAEYPDAEVRFLVEPDRDKLTEELWDDRGWDILFFAGHSSSQADGKTGKIAINPDESLTISQLKNALKKAIARGLKIAIFNSCDGLGLARELADLHLPQMLVMREPVPDRVAQAFLKSFLDAFSHGNPFYLAVREAREKLQALEDRFPCATWLPTICQNPAVLPPTWQDLTGQILAEKPGIHLVDQPITMVFTDLVNSTGVKHHLEGSDVGSRNRRYFDTILQPHRDRVEANLADFGGRVVKTEGDAYFLSFTSTVQAVKWSVALQKSHLEHPIATPLGPLQVKIGMHTGTPLTDGDDFIGQEVDYAARVASHAKGREIWISEVSAVFVRNAQIHEITITDRGSFYLKGIGDVPLYNILYDNQFQQPTIARSVGWRPMTIVSTLATATVLGMRFLGFLQPGELAAFDQLIRWRPTEPPDSRLLIVTITETDVQAQDPTYRRGSLSDATLEKLLQKLDAFQPRAIGLDIYRDYPVQRDLPHLAKRLQQNDRLIATCKVSDRQFNNPGIPSPPEVPPERLGFSDFITDADGRVRRHLLALTPEPTSPCLTPYAFNLQLAFRYLAQEGIQGQWTKEGNLLLGKKVFPRLAPRTGAYQNIDTGGQQILLNYRAAKQVAALVTLGDVLNGQVNPASVRDRLVIVGTTAESFGDYWHTPYSRGHTLDWHMSGVALQAQMVSQILSTVLNDRPLLRAMPPWGDLLWIWGWSLLGGVMAWRFPSPRVSRREPTILLGSMIAVMVITIGGSCWLGLIYLSLWLPWVPATLSSIATLAILKIYHQPSDRRNH